MRIAYLIGTLNSGGAEILALNVLRQAKASKLDIVFLFRHSGNLFDEFNKTGVPIYQFTPKSKYDIFSIIKLNAFLRKHHIDVIHIHQEGDCLLAYMSTLFTNIKIAYTIHGHIYNRNYHTSLIKLNHHIASKIIYVSKFQQQFYKEEYNLSDKILQKSIVLQNGIDFGRFGGLDRYSDCTDIKHNFNSLKMCMVGSFVSGRNQLFVCQFLNYLINKNTTFDFYFIGAKSNSEPYLYDKCIKFCNDNDMSNVHFLGARNDVPSLLKLMDAFIYASVDDTFGIAVIEAISTGIPVFVNDWNVMMEITDNGNLANIYKTNNIEDLYSKFIHFINNRQAYSESAKTNSVVVTEKYNINKHVEQLKSIYSSIIKS